MQGDIKFFRHSAVWFYFLIFQLFSAEIPFGKSFLFGARIKDIAYLESAERMNIVGYGLVTGLEGTGDGIRSAFTTQSVCNMLKKFNLNVPEDKIRLKNTAAVMVTASLTPFTRKGSRVSVTVSSIGDAKSLKGGVLLPSPLLGEDGVLYCIAQGTIITSDNTKGTMGRIPDGGIVKNSLPYELGDTLSFSLRNPDFSVSVNIAKVINTSTGKEVATPVTPGKVEIVVPEEYKGRAVEFVAICETLNVVSDNIARVVIQQSTATIIAGENVEILPCNIVHGDLKIEITPTLPRSTTAVAPGSVMPIEGASTVLEIANALNKLGVSPKDVISIFQALKEAGALKSELVVL